MTQEEGWRELYRHSLKVPDSRDHRGKRHKLSELLFLAVVALLAGAQDAEDIAAFGWDNSAWFRRFLVLEHGVPSHDRFLEVLALVKAEEIERLVRAWTVALRSPEALTVQGMQVAFDGQALRGSIDRAAKMTAVDLVSAYLTGAGVVLGSKRVDDKSNEIKAIPNLIRSLNLQGATVTIDAIGCQREIAADLREAGAHLIAAIVRSAKNMENAPLTDWAGARSIRLRTVPSPGFVGPWATVSRIPWFPGSVVPVAQRPTRIRRLV